MVIKILNYISDYNIVFVKIFQWIWNNNNYKNEYITNKIQDEIYRYTNNTPYIEEDIDYKSLTNIYMLANNNNEKFKLDDLKPMNTGSVSLIFKGNLNGKDIVIKLLRKNIKKKIESGINFLINLENIIINIPIINIFYGTKIFENNKYNIINQSDFNTEIKNINLFYDNFKNNKYIIIPSSYTNYTNYNSNIIIMDYIEGQYLNDIEKDDYKFYIKYFIKFIVNSLFIKHIFHCDLHQGNVLFVKNFDSNKNKYIYKIGIIDFGMIKKLEINEVNFIYLLLIGIFDKKMIDLFDFMEDTKNYSFIFESSKNINETFKYLRNLYINNEIFNNLEIETVINDLYLFLKILNKFNCNISSTINYYILSTIPILSILTAMHSNSNTAEILIQELNKFSNKSLLE